MTPGAKTLIVREGTDPASGPGRSGGPSSGSSRTRSRALLQGTFKPGDTIVADADPTSGTLVFSTGDRTVVVEAGDRRDARSSQAAGEPAGAVAGSRACSPLDLPPTGKKRDDDSGLVN